MGYKQAIRDRMPPIWVMALKYLGKLDAYIELVYSTRFRPINHHWNRKEQKEKKKKELHDLFKGSFFDTLDELRMEEHVYRYWLQANKWVKWFQENYLFIKDIYERFPNELSEQDKIAKVAKDYCNNDLKLSKAIIDHIKQEANETI